MTELARPAAKRLQRPSWKDGRLLVGVVLVLLAATLGAKAVASADDRVPVYVATEDLVAGDRVTATSFTRVDVRLGEGLTTYLAADAPAPEGSYLLRDVRAGELVPGSAVGLADEVRVQRVTVRADAVATAGLARGTRVDVYVTPKAGSSRDVAPETRRVLEAVGVAAVQTRGGSLGGSATTSVQVYVPSDRVQDLVEAVDAQAKVTLVPVPGAASDGAS
jgi:hypothetical protein